MSALERDQSLTEASELLRRIAGPGEAGETKKSAWRRAYKRLGSGWTFNRVVDLWRREPRAKVSAQELEELRRLAGESREEKAGEIEQLLARVEAIERRLSELDPAMARETVDPLRRAVRRMGREAGGSDDEVSSQGWLF